MLGQHLQKSSKLEAKKVSGVGGLILIRNGNSIQFKKTLFIVIIVEHIDLLTSILFKKNKKTKNYTSTLLSTVPGLKIER